MPKTRRKQADQERAQSPPAALSSLWLGVALIALVFAACLPALSSGYVWDDDTFLTENPLIHAADGPLRFWFTAEAPDYFPLTSTMLWVEWRLWGGRPAGFHAVNVLLHGVACVLFWRILLRLRVRGAWLAAAIFALHPLAVESVAWITERKNTLSTALCLAALLAYLRGEDGERPKPSYALALGAFVLALAAKSHAVVLAPALFLCAWWRRGRVGRTDLGRAAPFFALALAFGLVTVWFQSTNAIRVTVVRDDGFLSRLAIAGRALWFYLGKALMPVDLCFVYPRWPTGASGARAFLPLIAFAAVLAIAWSRRGSWGRPVCFALGWFSLALLPVLGFVDIYFMRYSLVADHWQHLALLAPAAAVAAGLDAWFAGRSAAAVIVLGLLATATWRRQAAFRDEWSLWTHTAAENPEAWIAHANLGELLHDEGRLAEASGRYRAALAIEPGMPELHYNLGRTLQALGRFDEASCELEEALRLDPGHASARNGLGTIALARGRIDLAVASFHAALELDPSLAAGHTNLGNAEHGRGRFEAAIPHYEAALELRPDSVEALSNLGSTLQELGRPAEAVELHRRAVEITPESAGLYFNLGNALREAGMADEAIQAYRRALELDPGLSGAGHHLDQLQARQRSNGASRAPITRTARPGG